jgi:ketosteroid isomerase-like protein
VLLLDSNAPLHQCSGFWRVHGRPRPCGRSRMSEGNKQVAVKFVEAMGKNDPEGLAACLAPDAVAVAMGTTKFAGKRDYDMMVRGVEQFKQILPEGLQFDILSATADGDRVAVEARGNGTTAQGKPYHNTYCFMITLKDGLITHVNEYFCTKLADEVLWPMVEGTGMLDQTMA